LGDGFLNLTFIYLQRYFKGEAKEQFKMDFKEAMIALGDSDEKIAAVSNYIKKIREAQ
jgi:hypothetical protein